MSQTQLLIREIEYGDLSIISNAFGAIGWIKPAEQYERYLREQNEGLRSVLVAFVADAFAGYVTVNRHPTYLPFADAEIPEIQDLNVLPRFRRCGIATRLMDHAEEIAHAQCEEVGIGMGLHPGYGAAQRMYVLRGYVPDGKGVTYRDEFAAEGQRVVLDDDLVLHFVKRMGAGG